MVKEEINHRESRVERKARDERPEKGVTHLVSFVLFVFLQMALPKPSRRSPSPLTRATANWIQRLGLADCAFARIRTRQSDMLTR